MRLACVNAWSGETATYYWDVRWPWVDGTSPRTWDLYFADEDFGADGTVHSCSGSAFFYYADSSFFQPGAYDTCGKVTWTRGGECRKLAALPASYDPGIYDILRRSCDKPVLQRFLSMKLYKRV